MRFVRSNRGALQIEVDNHIYSKYRAYQGHFTWRCSKFNCEAKLKTNLDFEREIIVLGRTGVHNHETDESLGLKKVIVDLMKELLILIQRK